jgi:hypothetical protein
MRPGPLKSTPQQRKVLLDSHFLLDNPDLLWYKKARWAIRIAAPLAMAAST